MKTLNSTLWSSIYCSASKYNIAVYTSKIKYCVLFAGVSLAIITFILTSSYLFHLAIALVVFSVIAVNIYLANSFHTKQPQYRILVTTQGSIQFIDNRGQVSKPMQLSDKSRASALGCWLVAQVSSADGQEQRRNGFIFKDSVSAQNYSRLVRVIRSL